MLSRSDIGLNFQPKPNPFWKRHHFSDEIFWKILKNTWQNIRFQSEVSFNPKIWVLSGPNVGPGMLLAWVLVVSSHSDWCHAHEVDWISGLNRSWHAISMQSHTDLPVFFRNQGLLQERSWKSTYISRLLRRKRFLWKWRYSGPRKIYLSERGRGFGFWKVSWDHMRNGLIFMSRLTFYSGTSFCTSKRMENGRLISTSSIPIDNKDIVIC